MKVYAIQAAVTALVCCCLRLTGAFGPSFLRIGMCSDVAQQPDFDIEQFTGMWYGILRVPNEYSPLKRCITSHFTSVDENGRFMNSRTGVSDNGTEVHSEVELMIMHDKFNSYAMPEKDSRPQVGISVFETDYTNFACFYSCIQRFAFKAEFVGVMSRTPTIKKAYVEQCRRTITQQSGFDWNHLTMVDQGETCSYWPEYAQKMEQRKLEEAKLLEEMAGAIDQAMMSAIEDDMENSEELLFFEPSSSAHDHSGLDFRVSLCVLLFLFTRTL